MSSTTLDKEMKIEDFKKILIKVTHNRHSNIIKLLGGEPTLHSRLFEMLELTRKKKLFTQIFTNGVIGRERVDKLAELGNNIGYTFNVMTPGFQHNKTLQNEVVKNMTLLGRKSKISLSISIDPFFVDTQFFLSTASLLPLIQNIRIGMANPIAKSKNWYQFSDFPKMGGILERFMRTARKSGFMGTFSPNCGFTRCMFTEEQYKYFKTQTKSIGWSCFGKGSSMDIAVDMSAFHCFPLSDHKRIDLTKVSYKEANKRLIKERMILWSQFKKKVCLKCPFYGFGSEKCPGPCIAFQINEKSI